MYRRVCMDNGKGSESYKKGVEGLGLRAEV